MGTNTYFSGAAADKSGPSNAAVMKQRAINAGVVASAIIVEELSESTDQNAKQTTSIFIERGLKMQLSSRHLIINVGRCSNLNVEHQVLLFALTPPLPTHSGALGGG